MSKVFSLSEVSKHNNPTDGYWLIVDSQVYDLTSFVDDHPGGKKILVNACGKDGTEMFWKFHSAKVLKKVGGRLLIGTIGEGGGEEAVVEKVVEVVKEETVAAVVQEDEDTTYFGDLVPFGDPLWYQDWASPYYNDSHRKLRTAVRAFTEKHLIPNAFEWDEAHAIPPAAYKLVADAGILAAIAAGGTGWPFEYAEGIQVPGGIDPKEWDAFHNVIVIDEISRCGSGGILYGIIGGFGIGLPPVLHFGSEELKKRIVGPCLRGEDRICLAITEPEGGSDVANMVTSAVKNAEGTHYIVNGNKKWITGGIHSRYFVTAVRTGGKGFGGISLMVIEKGEGVTTRQMDCSGAWSSGTSYISFEDVKVPVGNLLGAENVSTFDPDLAVLDLGPDSHKSRPTPQKGFQLIMANFNPERIGIAIQANRFARVCLEDSIKYASQRKTFGVLLRDHPVIRNKLAHMSRKVESTHAWLESIIYQSTQYDAETLMMRGGGMIALLKLQATETFAFCAAEAAQIFGGLSYTRGGQGERVERLYREVRAFTIPGGSSEIMADLGMRQSIKIAEIMGAKL